jgi:ribulose-5-phosphate 4-epimerase/fuculose-1-phosphate aldolase
VNSPELGADVAACLGSKSAVVLYGHGLVSVGSGQPEQALAEAVLRASAIDSLARMTLTVRAAGGNPVPISNADLAQLLELGAGLNIQAMWRHLTARAAAGSLYKPGGHISR